MVLEFERTHCSCLRQIVQQVQNQEQTQEIRLPDTMPDIGKVVGCWGQVLIRGKEWRSEAMCVNGGVMVWALYAPEDGSEDRCLESWIPFQMAWDLPQTQRDGTISVLPLLKSVDARSISARKLMLRCVVSILGEAMEPVEEELYMPISVPEDVQLLKQNYPVELPLEAGEKSFQIEEILTQPDIRKVIRYEIQPQITEVKIMASRLVFRGVGKLHMLYCDAQNKLQSLDSDLQFAQYADLDQEYGSAATAWIVPILNGAESEITEDGKLVLKCAITAQYVIYDRKLLEVVEDAYSIKRQLELQTQMVNLPIRLEIQERQMDGQCQVQTEDVDVIDTAVLYTHPVYRQNSDRVQMEMDAHYQVLCRDANGNLQTKTGKETSVWEMESNENNKMSMYIQSKGQPDQNPHADGVVLQPNGIVHTAVFSHSGIPMIKALELTDDLPSDLGRPSLILRRVGEQNVWQIAKECGSTVDAIRKANNLQQEPQDGQMLLIPVL